MLWCVLGCSVERDCCASAVWVESGCETRAAVTQQDEEMMTVDADAEGNGSAMDVDDFVAAQVLMDLAHQAALHGNDEGAAAVEPPPDVPLPPLPRRQPAGRGQSHAMNVSFVYMYVPNAFGAGFAHSDW